MKEVFDRAFQEFLVRERKLILTDVSEVNLCARLAFFLENSAHAAGFGNYYADPEYNRKQEGRVKTILDDHYQVVAIRCDLILHSRGEIVARDNLIAVEMKKSNRPATGKEEDKLRLRALTKASYDGVWSNDGIAHPEHVCGYELGVYIELDIRNTAFKVEEFRSGTLTDTRVGQF